jgi:predicted transposase YdaD
MAFFKTRRLEEFDMLAKKYPEVGGAVVELKRLSWSERHRMIADSREKMRRDYAAMAEEAREEGLAEGEARGKAEGLAEGEAKGLAEGEARGKTEGLAEGEARGLAEGRLETARKMKALGLPIDTIAAATGLSPKEIKDI